MPVSSRIITLLSALALLQAARGGVAVYNVSTLAGSGVAGGTDGVGALATFSAPTLLLDDARGVVYIAKALEELTARSANGQCSSRWPPPYAPPSHCTGAYSYGQYAPMA